MDYSKALFIKEHRDAAENLSEGQIFSAFDFPLTYTYNFGNEIRSSSPAYMIYLGEDPSHLLWNHVRFLVVLKNGDTMVISESRGNIERYLDKGWIKKSNKRTQLLQEIQNYLPERQTKEKENVQIVGSEVNFGKKDVTPINLPPEIKNNLLRFLGRYPDDENQFPNDFINEYSKKDKDDEDDNQKAGRKSRKSRKSRKTKRSRKSRKTRKTKRTHKSKKYRKSKR
jgi:hypothetical protein